MVNYISNHIYWITFLGIFFAITTTTVVKDKKIHGIALQFNDIEPAKIQITAYASQEELPLSGNCPVYKKRIDTDTSKSENGIFVLKVSEEQQPFLATACDNDYYPRIITSVKSREGDSLFIPHPLKMHLRRNKDEVNLYPAISKTFDTFVSDIQYLKTIDPDEYMAALSELYELRQTPAEQQLIEALGEIVQ